MSHTDSPRDIRRVRERKALMYKVLSYVYSMVDTVIGFFVVWTFFSMMRIVVGMSSDIYWLSKALIQQVAFILVALVMCCIVIVGQWLFEKAMNARDTWMPKSFLVLTAALVLLYVVFKAVVLLY